jgi:type II secretory pathway pseudopilin PulG
VSKKSGDAGFTLIDLMVAAAVMTMVMAVFTANVVRMYRTSNYLQARAISQTQIGTAMHRMDGEVRYAVGISEPYAVSGGQAVDMLVAQKNARTCVQIRAAAGVLTQRTWTYLANPLNLTPWTTLATGLASNAPFDYLPPTDTLSYQQLAVMLTVGTGTGTDVNAATFTALNSDRTTGQDYCAAARALP